MASYNTKKINNHYIKFIKNLRAGLTRAALSVIKYIF